MFITKKKNGSFEHERVSWKEWFWIMMPDVRRDVGVGEMCPRFYLPVGQNRQSGQLYCWILPLAPFAMIGSLALNAFKSIWFDLAELVWILSEFAHQKKTWWEERRKDNSDL